MLDRKGVAAHIVIWILTALANIPTGAQMLPVGDAFEDYARVLQLAGRAPEASFSVRPLATRFLLVEAASTGDHPWASRLSAYERGLQNRAFDIRATTAETESYWNSVRPHGGNDGSLWQGRGITSSVSAGLFAKAGPLTMEFRPTFAFVQNRSFELSPLKTYQRFSEYAYATLGTASGAYPVLKSTIDWPQRHGAHAFTSLNPGQSYVRLEYREIGIGVSTENLWWGPGMRNSISMSNNAPGIHHAFIGTSRPVDIWMGHLESRLLWGRLLESDYYDFDDQNDERFFTAAAVAFSPHFAPGLSLGVTRSFNKDLAEDYVETSDYFLVFENLFKKSFATRENPSGLDQMDQMITLFGRWMLPASGFELYGEWAKGDHSWDFRDALVQLQHASGYTVGWQKVIETDARHWWRLRAEITKLEAPRSDVVRGAGGYFYEHVFVRHGHTNRGQIMGAVIGPGSNSQFAGVDVFSTWGRAGGFLCRAVYNNDRYYRTQPGGEAGHEVDIEGGLRGLYFWNEFELEGSISLTQRLNKYYEVGHDELNVRLSVAIRRSIMSLR